MSGSGRRENGSGIVPPTPGASYGGENLGAGGSLRASPSIGEALGMPWLQRSRKTCRLTRCSIRIVSPVTPYPAYGSVLDPLSPIDRQRFVLGEPILLYTSISEKSASSPARVLLDRVTAIPGAPADPRRPPDGRAQRVSPVPPTFPRRDRSRSFSMFFSATRPRSRSRSWHRAATYQSTSPSSASIASRDSSV